MIDSQVIAFTIVAAALTVAPGADTMLVVRNVLRGGRRDGFFAMAGICTGLYVHALLSALGISVILMHSATAFGAAEVAVADRDPLCAGNTLARNRGVRRGSFTAIFPETRCAALARRPVRHVVDRAWSSPGNGEAVGGLMGRVIHFEIQATQPQELVDFYTALLGWTFGKWGGPNAPAMGQPVNRFVCTIETPSLDEHLDQGAMLGGTVVVPKMPVPGVGWIGYLKDPDAS